MKTLKQLNSVEKAKILHTWFPDEIPAFLEAMESLCEAIRADEAHYREQWAEGLFTFDFWLTLLRQAEAVIQQYGKKLCNNPRLFAHQLFDGYQAIFSAHCLTRYAMTRQRENRKFYTATDLFFNI